ncbi:MAG TPA: DUF4446 family protein [Clostridiales bacterium]|nr:DUF4446 family protein [Clostridiales bacterium]
MNDLNLSENMLYIIIMGLILIIFITILVMSISNSIKINKLYKKYNKFMACDDGKDLEELLEKCILRTDEVSFKHKEIENHLNELDRNISKCLQKSGIIRFNAFDDVGSDLSYSLALLDGNDNGVVITSLFSRDSSTTYGKPITGGKSKYALSAEEIKAINDAIRKNRESQYV